MVLLETETWDQYCEVSSSMVGGGRYTVSGRIEVGSGHPVTAVADRRYLRSIAVWSDWAAAVHPDDLGDEILTCAERIRSMRPRFSVRYDYSRYSESNDQNLWIPGGRAFPEDDRRSHRILIKTSVGALAGRHARAH
ncbi:hypothetical protein IU468_28615, partial [Nocardia farcinica]|uniref:hypothetical protein n=1 Tax=Nocardia farcinica TaxID=37329 RepID=UPI001893B44A